jgi:hypothetical protein
MTLHLALIPQVFGQGSIHLRLTQAKFCEHSELDKHSGRHAGGDPV